MLSESAILDVCLCEGSAARRIGRETEKAQVDLRQSNKGMLESRTQEADVKKDNVEQRDTTTKAGVEDDTYIVHTMPTFARRI